MKYNPFINKGVTEESLEDACYVAKDYLFRKIDANYNKQMVIHFYNTLGIIIVDSVGSKSYKGVNINEIKEIPNI